MPHPPAVTCHMLPDLLGERLQRTSSPDRALELFARNPTQTLSRVQILNRTPATRLKGRRSDASRTSGACAALQGNVVQAPAGRPVRHPWGRPMVWPWRTSIE